MAGPAAKITVGSGLAVIAFGLAFLAPAIWMAREQYRIVRTWPETQAEGAAGNVVTYRDEGRAMYRAEYDLRYRVNGREYVTPISSSISSSSEARAQREAGQYGAGTHHMIRYNPANPHDIRLHAGLRPRFFVLPLAFGGAGLVVVLAGVALVVVGRRAAPPLRCPSCQSEIEAEHTYCRQCGTHLTENVPADAPPPLLGSDSPAERMRRHIRRGNKIGGVVFSAIGLLLLGAAAWTAKRQHTIMTSWPETQAVVTRSELERSRGSEGRLAFQPRIEFRYTVAGREHTAVAAAVRAGNYAWAAEKVDRHAPATRHAVRYDPANPADIRFDAGFDIQSMALPLVFGLLGGVFAPLGLALLYAGLRTTHVPCPACGLMLPKAAKFCADCGRPADAMAQ